MANCATCKDVVDDEIGAQISSLSSDPVSRLNGLHLALWLPVGISGDWGGDGPRVSHDSPLWRFWQGRRDVYVRTNAKSIIAACDDTGIRIGALMQGLITVDYALQMNGGLLSLFQHQSIEIFGIERSAYLLDVVAGLILGWPGYYDSDACEPSPKTINELDGIGRYLIHNPQPPWITGPADAWPDFFWGHPAMHDTSRMILDSAAYLGAAAILLVTAECMKSRVLPNEGRKRFGPLSKVYPYIERRWHIEPDCALPILPIPREFQKMFYDWADKRISFVDICLAEGRRSSVLMNDTVTATCHQCHRALTTCLVCSGDGTVSYTFGNCTECNGTGFLCSTHGKYWNT